MNNPIDLLPIGRPLSDTTDYSGVEFYNNVVQYLIKDVIRLMDNGIPINLDKVKELENTLDNILINVQNKLKNNILIQEFISEVKKDKETKELNSLNIKDWKEFRKEYNPKDKIQRSFIINYYLKEIKRNDLILNEWSIKDLKKLNELIATKFLSDIINNDLSSYTKNLIEIILDNLAKHKADLYNKNKKDKKLKQLNDLNIEFNPASTKQKEELFFWLDIKSENITEKGNPKWDRDELERLQKLLNTYLEN